MLLYSTSSIADLLVEVLTDRQRPKIRSQSIPGISTITTTTADNEVVYVRTLVGSEFSNDGIILRRQRLHGHDDGDEENHPLEEQIQWKKKNDNFCVPWCGHCAHLAPKWDELGWEVKTSSLCRDFLEVASLDATENEVDHPCVDLTAFPTIYLFPITSLDRHCSIPGIIPPTQLMFLHGWINTGNSGRPTRVWICIQGRNCDLCDGC